MSHPARLLILIALLAWHALAVSGAWSRAQRVDQGRDYATYHYAVQVAFAGEDPYARANLHRAAQRDGTRRSVYPYLYPPPFLLAASWTSWLPLKTGYLSWFWLNELALAVAAAALSRWWGRREPDMVLGIVGAIALATAFPSNLVMGQANLIVLALTIVGLWQADRGRWALGGALVGLAVALKLSPAVVVAWWLLRGRWPQVVVALAAGLTAMGVSTLVFGVNPLFSFVTEVLPSLSSGAYNGLGLPVHLYGNHSLPNLWHTALPSGGPLLSTGARIGASVTALVLVAGLAWRFGPPTDALARHAQVAAVLVLGLLLPVFTYEHHMVWALPAVVLAAVALRRGRLHPFWAIPLGLSLAAWAFELASLKAFSEGHGGWLGFIVREVKCFALLVLLAAMGWLGGGTWRRSRSGARDG